VSEHITSATPGQCVVQVEGQQAAIRCERHAKLPPHTRVTADDAVADEEADLDARLLLASLQAYALGAVGEVWVAEHDEDTGDARVLDAQDIGPGDVVICETHQWPDEDEQSDTALHIAANDPRTVMKLTTALTCILDLGGEPARIVREALLNDPTEETT
jgi:hypothetical protein